MQRAVLALLVWVAFCGAALPSANADAAVTLAFHFKAGDALTYAVTTVETEHSSISGQPAAIDSTTTTYQTIYVVHSVDVAGNATMSATNTPGHAVRIHNGKTTRATVPPGQLSTPADACIQEIDGIQYCVYRGGYGLGDFGQTPEAPIALGGSWESTIDNTWGLDHARPVTVHNILTSIGSSAYGRIATISSTVHVSGPATYTSGGKSYATNVVATQTGTWQLGVTSGLFVSQDVVQSSMTTGTLKDKRGTHALRQSYSIGMKMRLTANTVSAPHALGKGYSTNTYSPIGAGYTLTYPSSWKKMAGTSGNFQIESPDGDALVAGIVAPNSSGDIANPAFVARFLRGLGTPIGAVAGTVRTINAKQYGVADAVIRLTGKTIEAQVEVRASQGQGGISVIVGLVGLGSPGLYTRPANLARDYEQVQRTLNSVTPAAIPGVV